MAKRNIKGITIEIGGDTTKLDKALNKSDKAAKDLAGKLKDVENLLKLDPKNVELLAQKQDFLAQKVEQTGERYNMLKSTLDSVTASNPKWEQWEKEQAAIQGQVTRTQAKLADLQKQAKEMQGLGFAPDSEQMVELQGKISATTDKLSELEQKAKDTYDALGRPVSVEQYQTL